MTAALVHAVVAHNDAVDSENKIHDDAVARQYGFSGGLVPGVTVYGYLCWAPASRWGRAWLERGTLSARFVHPVYEGDRVEVRATPRNYDLEVAVVDSAGRTCATGTATLPDEPLALPDLAAFPPPVPLPPPDERPPATAAVLGKITLGTVEHRWDAGLRAEHQARLGDDLRVYADAHAAHPGALIRAANQVLHRSVRLGPWIHVGTDTVHHALVPEDSAVATRGRVVDLYERKGHQFVELDVVATVGDRAVWSARHVAIYQPRRVDDRR